MCARLGLFTLSWLGLYMYVSIYMAIVYNVQDIEVISCATIACHVINIWHLKWL